MKHTFHPHTLTFEEFSTALAKIETCINSSPLCSFTSDPEDLNVLIAVRFLLGVCSSIVPDTDSFQTPTDQLGRFELFPIK
jgi:hypothetical protein